MPDVTVKLDEAQIRAIEGDPETRAEVLRAADGMAELARQGAPRRTGRGAASIRGTVSADDPDAVDVSWSHQYEYMINHEFGFRDHPGRHFLSRAFETYALS